MSDSGSLMTRPLDPSMPRGGIKFLCIPSTTIFSFTNTSCRISEVLFLFLLSIEIPKWVIASDDPHRSFLGRVYSVADLCDWQLINPTERSNDCIHLTSFSFWPHTQPSSEPDP
ncbi:hypothetical protein Tco_0895987 [Tanacetum coccineum]|uniref:Uncharacterized protein n=1 Tax=Tanacetum coccineum TaxID=301880 RepID=A0ABQ5CG60_9ASTR